MTTQHTLSTTQTLACTLMSEESVTPNDKNCQQILVDYLASSGFIAEAMPFAEVDNLWLRRGTKAPVFCFAGHTDVVPTGDLKQWHSPPFTPDIRDGYLYGRGAADMKGSIAAMTVAYKRFVEAHPNHHGSLALLITSDEEGPAKNGTVKVIETLEARHEKIDLCLVGEPSSSKHVGDIIKNGRRGSIGCKLQIHGKQGHVAYPELAENPIHSAGPFISALVQIQWDQGNQFFPPTSLQISNINAGTGATNVIPGDLEMLFNLRFSTETTPEHIIATVENLLKENKLKYSIEWNISGLPFLTGEGKLVAAAQEAIQEVTGLNATLSTGGGTSDGRFIAPTGAQVLELGPVNATIHQVNECVSLKDLDTLERIYYQILVKLLT